VQLKKIDHIGILVKSIESSLELYRERFGLPLRNIEVNREYGVRIAFLPLGEALIELVEPLPGSPFEKILREKGEGFHHIAFEVDHLKEALGELKSAGVPLRDSTPKRGGEGAAVAFLEAAAANGVAVELKEKASP